ncbi:5'-methylthioadenosine/adenosylhomocysteine nucleosidase [Bacillus shivajii]|uniref:5'-methylthioadenosine/adenosylhomocysteine nucleosidase n=1 Tax=Bacillus shivajii TaxID=1983719 RepID=UPI001CFA0413|nr:5'-methylthioadenosine/adenosylhomocysteine nucleosidase [Bacillus shivajii]UCZ55134.1 5'-methylthioadenosine/adenosylhomocysteine nucleosidase [Bacillus shivajii]
MGKIGVIGAMQVEIDLILDKMDVQKEYSYAGFSFYSGVLYGKEIVLARCGVGKVNAASCTQIMIDRFDLNYMINTGIAGSLRKDIHVCDIVISTDVTHHDVRQAQMKNLFPFQERFIASKELIELAIKACESVRLHSNYHCGRVISGECFVEDRHQKELLINTFKPACVEMEGASIAHVSFINKIPFLIIRCISDHADDDATNSYENFEKTAGKQSSSIVIEMVKRF